MSRYIIVNERNEQVALKHKSELVPTDIVRVSALWMRNSKGEFLLARRALNKKSDPGRWGPAVAGTLEEGETYESNIIKEAAEELGLAPFELVEAVSEFYSPERRLFCRIFALERDVAVEDLVLQADEVMDARWFSPDELRALAEEQPEMFTPSIPHFIEEICAFCRR